MNSDSIYSACSKRQLRGVRRKLKVAMTYATECKKALLIKKRTVVDNSKISTVSHITNMCFFIKGEKKNDNKYCKTCKRTANTACEAL